MYEKRVGNVGNDKEAEVREDLKQVMGTLPSTIGCRK